MSYQLKLKAVTVTLFPHESSPNKAQVNAVNYLLNPSSSHNECVIDVIDFSQSFRAIEASITGFSLKKR